MPGRFVVAPRRAVLFEDASSLAAGIVASLGSRAAVVDVVGSDGRIVVFRRSYEPATEGGRASYRGGFDLYATPVRTPSEEEAETMIGTSLTEAAGNATLFIGSGGLSVAEADVEVAVNRAGSASLLWVVTSVAPGVGGTFTYTLRKNGVDTGLTVTLSGSTRIGGSAATPAISYNQGDRFSIKLVTAGAARAFHNWSLKYL